MLLSTIRANFQARIEDAVYWNDTKANALANEAMRKVAGKLDLKFQAQEELVLVSGTKQYSVPSDYIANYLLWYDEEWDADEADWAGSYNQKITMVDGPDEIIAVVGEPDESGQPTHAYLWAIEDRRDLFLYPVPDNEYRVIWYYYREPPALVLDNDEPKVARELHQYLIDWMILRAKTDDGDISEERFVVLEEKLFMDMRMSNSRKEALRRRHRIPDGRDLFTGIAAADGSVFDLANDGDILWRSVG